MLLVRQVFQAKYGRGDELVALFKEGRESMPEGFRQGSSRLLTDASGPFFTVVTEYEIESFAAWEQQFAAMMAQPDMENWFARMVAVVESGSREFYNIVE